MSPIWKHERQWAGKWQMVRCYAAVLVWYRDRNPFHVCIHRRKVGKEIENGESKSVLFFPVTIWVDEVLTLHLSIIIFLYSYIYVLYVYIIYSVRFEERVQQFSIQFHRKTNLMMVWVAYLDPKRKVKMHAGYASFAPHFLLFTFPLYFSKLKSLAICQRAYWDFFSFLITYC